MKDDLTKVSRMKPIINNQMKVKSKRDDKKVIYRAIED